MASRTVTLPNPTGLHARPAKVFASAVAESGHQVRLTKGDTTVDGTDADAVLESLVLLVESGLGEDGPR